MKQSRPISLVYFLKISFIPMLLFACSAHSLTGDADSASGTISNNEQSIEVAKKIFMFQGPGAEPWVTDGTPEGTMMIPVYPGGTSFAYGFTPFKKDFYFHANGPSGFELWKSDGTVAGTVLVKDINPGPGNAFRYRFADFAVFRNEVYFQADDGVHGFELWKTDGTAEGTVLVKDINILSPGGSSSPGEFTFFKDELYFSAYMGVGGYKLWKTDGTEAGTLQVSNINRLSPSFAPDAVPRRFGIYKDELYLQADDGSSGYGLELWKTDGTAAGTVLVKDINPGGGGSYPSDFTEANNTLYFRTTQGADSGLWKTDGTTAGTQVVKGISILARSNGVSPLTPLGKLVFFQGYDPLYYYELWVSDGTEAGTRMVKDINLENGGSNSDYVFDHYTVFKDELYFQTHDNINGYRLWKTDGTADGTQLLKVAEPNFATFGNFTVLKDALYFTLGGGLWKTDGSPEGTVLVKALY